MNTKQAAAKLLPILEGCESTAEFLEAVKRALETMYADESDICPEGCPAGFEALDTAIEAFQAHDEATG
jgi:hypothetical protein